MLGPETRLNLVTLLPKDIHLELQWGRIDLEVTHVEGRSFVVTAAGYEVKVIGTHLAIELDSLGGERVLRVNVDRGRVRVTRVGEPAEIRVLGVGETWSTKLDLGPDVAPRTDTPKVDPPIAPVTAENDAGTSAIGLAPSTTATTAPFSPVSAKELWTQAEAARSAKRFQDEAAALNLLRLRHRSDPRSGLAAFELGRLRQDTLHDPSGAAEAFADAIALAPSGPFREDAEARRVEALDAAGRRQQCLEAKATFLARYKGGIHRERVSVMCDQR